MLRELNLRIVCCRGRFYKNLASPGDGSGGRHTHVSGDVKKRTLAANGEYVRNGENLAVRLCGIDNLKTKPFKLPSIIGSLSLSLPSPSFCPPSLNTSIVTIPHLVTIPMLLMHSGDALACDLEFG